jgi:hypothetical protein
MLFIASCKTKFWLHALLGSAVLRFVTDVGRALMAAGCILDGIHEMQLYCLGPKLILPW